MKPGLCWAAAGSLPFFPLAYAVVLPALYAPIIAMLIGLIFRGVAFEFRWRTNRGKFLWDWAFAGGSIMAAFAQGIALGALVQGIEVTGRAYSGGNWDWLTPFSLLTGGAVVIGYALLGSTWLILKTEGYVRDLSYRLSWGFAAGTLALIGLVSLITPFLNPEYLNRWFGWPTGAFTLIVPFLVLYTSWRLYQGLKHQNDAVPFPASLALFVLSFIGIGISFYPNMVPPDMTIWDAAAPDKSLMFLGWGALFLVPLILSYTAYSYWVFRGKVDPDQGYH